MLETAKTLSRAIPGAELRTLDGQAHDVQAEVLAPVLAEFFAVGAPVVERAGETHGT
jgi:hypothetical protein